MSDEERVEPLRFEAIIDELKRLVGRLEGGELPLEEALDLFEKGVKLTGDATALLEGAEKRVEELSGR